MEYTVIINNQSYDLPKKTIKIMEDMEKVSKIDSVKGLGIRDKFKTMFDFIESLVGAENAKEILGSDKLDEVDLCDVTLTFKKSIDAYDKPLEEYQTQQMEDQMRRIPVEQMAGITHALDSIARSGIAQGNVTPFSR